MSLVMPRGLVRICSNSCGYKAFTLHTGSIPCTTPGCDGHLGWPTQWPHVCTEGHLVQIDVEQTSPPSVPLVECLECQAMATKRRRR